MDHLVGLYFYFISISLLSVKNRQKEEEGERKNDEKESKAKRERKKKGLTLLFFSLANENGGTKFLYESREKTSLRSVLKIKALVLNPFTVVAELNLTGFN